MKHLARVFSVVSCAAAIAMASRVAQAEDIFAPVRLRNGTVHGSVRLSVLHNPTARPGRNGLTVLAVHGMTSTGNALHPLAHALFRQSRGAVRRVVILNLLGHGGSSLPAPSTVLKFGDMTLSDQVETLTGVIRYLQTRRNMKVDSLFGHSMGGMLVQLAQQQFLDEGSSLRARYGVRTAVLSGTTVPAAVPWRFADSGEALRRAAPFVITTPTLGTHLSVPPEPWVRLWFTNPAGEIAPRAPTPERAAALGYIAPEPVVASLQLNGAPQTPRPYVVGGAFSCWRGTRLASIAYEQDAVVEPSELEALQLYLTGSTDGLTLIRGRYSVHDMLVGDPVPVARAIVRALRPAPWWLGRPE